MATACTRYGASRSIADSNDDTDFRALIDELRTEDFDEPDNEHTQVSVGNAHWTVTAQVSGLITFDNIDMLEGNESDLPETMYLRDIPDDQLIRIWRSVSQEDLTALLEHPWHDLESLPRFVADFYRKRA